MNYSPMEKMVKMLQKKKELPSGSYPGFGLLQVLMAVAIFALLATVALPNFRRQQTGYERKTFVTGLNALMAEAWQQALSRGKIIKVYWDFKARAVTVQEASDRVDDKGSPLFTPITLYQASNNFVWPESVEPRQFFINGADEMASRGAHGTTDATWFFVMPSGMAQDVVVNMMDTSEATLSRDGVEIGLVLNPFSAQFKVYNEFQKPSV